MSDRFIQISSTVLRPVRSLRCLSPVLPAVLLLATTALHAPPPDSATARLTLHFLLQEVQLAAQQKQQLRAFASGETANQTPTKSAYYLVQGFACDTGGFTVSLRVAGQRGRAVESFLTDALPSIPASPAKPATGAIRTADPVVLHGGDREKFRRAEVRAFRTAEDLQRALTVANQSAARWNLDSRIALAGEPEQSNEHGDVAGNDDARANLEMYFVIGLLLLLLCLGLIWLYAGRRENPERHRLSADEAEALEILTGGAVTPVPPRAANDTEDDSDETKAAGASNASKESARAQTNAAALHHATPPAEAGPIREFIRKARTQNMGVKKKTKTKITPISIRGAVDRDFVDKSLAELSRSPIHALEGLTPRHARMLEEAFGIKTVEDLARLKYVEIARAIVVLARYEK